LNCHFALVKHEKGRKSCLLESIAITGPAADMYHLPLGATLINLTLINVALGK
jgi:hypothetical protein